MAGRNLFRSVLAGLATLVWPSSAGAAWIIDVSVFPTCAITPEDRVKLEVFVMTGGTPGWIDQPTEVVVDQDQVSIDVYVRSGVSAAIDYVHTTVDLGTFEPGTYEYTITLNPTYYKETAVGEFSVGTAPCLPALDPPGRVYWTDSQTRLIKRSDLDGSKVENLVVHSMFDMYAKIIDLILDRESGTMYWTGQADGVYGIYRADLDGTNVEDLVTHEFYSLRGLALDLEAGWMYYCWPTSDHPTAPNARVRRARLDGSGQEDVISQGLHYPQGIVLDTTEGKVYVSGWQSPSVFRILRVDADGSNLETLISSEPARASYIAVDLEDGKIYWVESESSSGSHDGTMRRMNLDGSSVETLIGTGVDLPIEIVFDLEARNMYWAGRTTIQRARLDGSGLEDLLDTGSSYPLPKRSDLAIDMVGGKIYWTVHRWISENMPSEVRRANLDGSAVETIVSGLLAPDNIVFHRLREPIPTVSAWGLAVMVLLVVAAGTVVIHRRQRVA